MSSTGSSNCRPSGVIEINARDLENILPDVFYASCYRTHPTYQHLTNLLAALTRQGESELRAHLDIEKGLLLHDIFTFAATSPEKLFWTNKQQIILHLRGMAPQSLPCHTQTTCQQPARHQCACIIVQGIPANVLNDFVEFTRGKNRYTLKSGLDDSVRPEWLRLGAQIGSWCCGDDRLRM